MSRLYREVVFPVDDDMQAERDRTRLRQAVERVVELVAIGRAHGWVAAELAAAVEEPLARLARSIPLPAKPEAEDINSKKPGRERDRHLSTGVSRHGSTLAASWGRIPNPWRRRRLLRSSCAKTAS